MPKYIISGLLGRLTDRGTPNLPFLQHISSGERGGKSLIFHLQIGLKFVEVTIDKVRKRHVTLKCVTRNKCKYRAKMMVNKQFVTQIKHEKVDGKKSVINTNLIFLSELENIKNWTVLENSSTECSQPKCKKDFFFVCFKRFSGRTGP